MTDDLADEVIAALQPWQVLVVQYNDLVAERLGVAASDLQALFVLSHHGACSAGQLAQHIGLTTGAASRMVERLVRAELVDRRPHDRDRRRVVVTARPEALAKVGRLYGPLNDRLREDLQVFDERGLQAMLAFAHAAEGTTRRMLEAELGRSVG